MTSRDGYDGQSSPRSDKYSRPNRDAFNDPRQSNDRATIEIVDEFKRVVRDKLDQKLQINQANIELEVANIRRKKNPTFYSMDQWKRSLSDDLRNCPDCILRVSMAYGDNPNEVKSVLQEKLNATKTNVNPNNTGINSLIAPLQSLRRQLDDCAPPNLPRSVRDIDEKHLDRAVRLFLSEAFQIARALDDYRYDDAETAVRVIREMNYQSPTIDDLLPIFKSFREENDIRQYLQTTSKRSFERNDSPTTTVQHDRRSAVKPVDNYSNSSFTYKPLVNPYAQSDKQDHSRQGTTDRRDSKRNN